MVTFKRSSSMITPAECEYEVIKKLATQHGAKKEDLQKTQVDLDMLNISWLTADGMTFVDFVKKLKNTSSDKIYQTDLLEILLNEFWQENFDTILFYLLVPWAVYMLCMTYYYMTIL